MKALSLLLLAGCAAEPPAPEASPPPPPPRADPPAHLLLVVIDTLRADVLEEVDTPVLDALAREGAAASRSWSAGTWTLPSVISLFTGMPIRRHGWNEPTGNLGKYPPIPDATTLAEVLSGAGFATEGLYANPYLSEKIGVQRGFDRWRKSADPRMPSQLGVSVAASWGDGRRHFAYVHLIGPHSPLVPSEAAARRHGVDPTWFDEKHELETGRAKRDSPRGTREAYAKAYRAVVEDCDARVGELLLALGPHRAETLVVVTSDHGELLGEHDQVGHGHEVWQPLMHVPLIVDDPTVPGDREEISDTLGTAALADWMTERLGVVHTWPTSREAVLPLVSEREEKMALSPDGRLKGIWTEEGLAVYDLEKDPGELRPLVGEWGLAAARAAWEERTPMGAAALGEVELEPETVEALRTLGYMP